LHKITDLKIVSEKYWDYIFTNEYENKSEAELSNELNRLYLQAIKRRVKDKKNIFVSLSGGHDSRGIAAMLKECVNDENNILGFSHNFGENIKDTDADIAHRVAESLKIPFKLFNSYEGNPLHTFRYNAEYGQGIAYFCIESDGWENINKEFEKNESSILFVGDMNDGTFTEFH
jgi:asparagine synthetase B (glutamine-hydrolysing)